MDVYDDFDRVDDLLDVAVRMEHILDRLHIYAYRNWMDGLIVEGPTARRHVVSVSFMWPYESMPDPAAVRRLVNNGIRVHWTRGRKDVHDDPQMIDVAVSASVMQAADRYGVTMPLETTPKAKTADVWVVTLTFPRDMVDHAFDSLIPVEIEEVPPETGTPAKRR